MAEKLKIEIYRKDSIEAFSKVMAEPDAAPLTGSASAVSAALAAAFLERAAELLKIDSPELASESTDPKSLDYIIRNAEIIRNYMVYLVDEDVKCRGPIKKARAEGDQRKIEACIQPACAINSEIINMMNNLLELALNLNTLYGDNSCHFIVEAAESALCAIRLSISFIYSMLKYTSDDTYIYVTKRENEIAYKNALQLHKALLEGTGLPFEE